MDNPTLPGDPPIELILRRSAHARRISLRVSALDGRVTMSLPRNIPAAEAIDFAKQKEAWIRKHLAEHSSPQMVRIGNVIPVQGRDRLIEPGPVRAAKLLEATIQVPPTPEMVGLRVKTLLKLQAKSAFDDLSRKYATTLGRTVGRITLRDTRSRWGSCSANGNLMFSWRLIMAPSDVLDYVAAHEAAHLVEMNHSAAYWKIVREISPNYQTHRRWLRYHGASLHRYRFDD